MTDPESDHGNLRFAWYGRLSTDELQQPQLAFPSQRAACERRVRGIGRIVCEFTDVESGRSDDRAGIEALFVEAGRGDRRFDAVVTYEAERFARRMVLALAYEEELRLANISIYVSDEAGEPGRPTSVLTRRIKQAVGEWYVLELVEESRRGMEENTRQGFNTGGIAPYGYRKRFLPHPARSMAGRGKHKVVLEPDSEQALVVERIFRSSSPARGASAAAPTTSISMGSHRPEEDPGPALRSRGSSTTPSTQASRSGTEGGGRPAGT